MTTTRMCAWWRLQRHRWVIVKTRPHAPVHVVVPGSFGFTTFAWERCERCGAGRVHEFPGRWLDQYPRWED